MNSENFDISNLQSFIDNYEQLVQDLSTEIGSFQEEYSDLNHKIRNVVSENDKLIEGINFFIDKQTTDGEECHDNHLIENLKEQINLISSEKDYTVQLWQNAMTTIDHLEDELRSYQIERNDGELTLFKKKYQERIKELEEQLDQRDVKETASKVNSNINNDIFKSLENEILSLQKRLKETTKEKDDMRKTINKQNKRLKFFETKNTEYLEKVNEAVKIVEAACVEKDCALIRERQTQEELTKLSMHLMEVMQEAENKLVTEVEQVKLEFSRTMENVTNNLKKAQDETKAKQAELDTYTKKCALLEHEIEILTTKDKPSSETDNTKLLLLEKNLEKTFQKLITSEKENIILNAELGRMRNDAEEMLQYFENDIKTREIQKVSLEKKVEQLKDEIQREGEKYLKLLKELEEVKLQIGETKLLFKEELENKQKRLMLSHQEEMEFLKSENEIKCRKMEEQMKKQLELNKKWQTESNEMVQRFLHAMNCQRQMIKKMKTTNEKMKKKISTTSTVSEIMNEVEAVTQSIPKTKKSVITLDN